MSSIRTRAIPRDLTMSAPDIGQAERDAVMRVLDGTQLSAGPQVERFEAAIARVAGRSCGIAVSSGTAGLHLAVRALGIGRDDTVLTTSFSFVASVNCFLYEGARPVFADIDPLTLNIDPASAAEVARQAGPIAALLPVHVFGQPCDMTRLAALARESGWPIIEDACEALGSAHAGKPAGSFGELAVFAFYPNKQITTGEGGVIVTDDPVLAEVCRSLRNQGRGSDAQWLSHLRLGYNYRLDELSAAVGVAQAERLDALLARREDVAHRYAFALRSIPGVSTLTIAVATTRMSWFVYPITLPPGLDRDAVARRLAEAGIPSRPYFKPIHLQPYFVERFGDLRGSLPVTEDVGQRTIALPFHGQLSDESIGYVAMHLRAAIDDLS